MNQFIQNRFHVFLLGFSVANSTFSGNITAAFKILILFFVVNIDGDALLLYSSGITFLNPTYAFYRRIIQSMEFMFTGKFGINSSFLSKLIYSSALLINRITLFLSLQHPYVYGVLVFEAMATFIGQVSVLSLIALFGAATTAMVNLLSQAFPHFNMSVWTIVLHLTLISHIHEKTSSLCIINAIK
jgi:hypothetical protein